jgi:hypothetical protein
MPHLIGQLSQNIVLNVANSDMLPSLLGFDIRSCDFLLFGDLKAKLKGKEFETMEQLQWQVEEGLGRITSDTMQRA